mmetsp:Transcript_7582/g.25789  ORF Transcript_7582/g.25789 Transcript_7582/m.25789 type:complete len:257 (+) Transcript_7582:2-772(+)
MASAFARATTIPSLSSLTGFSLEALSAAARGGEPAPRDPAAAPLLAKGASLGSGSAQGAGAAPPPLSSGFSFDWSRGASKKGGAAATLPSLSPWGVGADPDGLPYHRRLQYFAVLLLTGAANLVLAGAFLPVVVLRPGKFSLFFTLGNALVLAAIAVLRGARAQARAMCGWQRAPFTAAYLGTAALTLYSALVARSHAAVLVFSLLQALALAHFVASYVPGGHRALRFVGGVGRRAASLVCGACCGGRSRAGLLPL